MANFDVSDPVFNTDMRKLEPSDPAHANTFNPMFEQLLKNDEAIRNMRDEETGEKWHFGVANGLVYVESDS